LSQIVNRPRGSAKGSAFGNRSGLCPENPFKELLKKFLKNPQNFSETILFSLSAKFLGEFEPPFYKKGVQEKLTYKQRVRRR
jgi:hypothetical protein